MRTSRGRQMFGLVTLAAAVVMGGLCLWYFFGQYIEVSTIDPTDPTLAQATPEKKPDRQHFYITLDYRLPFEGMVAAGRYNVVDEQVLAENFPSEGYGRVRQEVRLVPAKSIKTMDAWRDLESEHLRAVSPLELLAFGATYPDQQQQFRIVALGAPACLFAPQHALYLFYTDLLGRTIGTNYLSSGWSLNDYFLAAPLPIE
jgi:hypothetical protein